MNAYSTASREDVAAFGEPLTGLPVRFIRHRTYARRIDPAIVEVKQAADIDGVVDGFVRPSGPVHTINVRWPDRNRAAIDLLDKPK